MLSDLVFRLRSLFRRNTIEAELDDEVFIALSPLTDWFAPSGATCRICLYIALLRSAAVTQTPVEIVDGCGLHAAAVSEFEIAGFQSQKYRVLVVSDLSRAESLQIARTAVANIPD